MKTETLLLFIILIGGGIAAFFLLSKKKQQTNPNGALINAGVTAGINLLGDITNWGGNNWGQPSGSGSDTTAYTGWSDASDFGDDSY